jgi:hypothetical protein
LQFPPALIVSNKIKNMAYSTKAYLPILLLLMALLSCKKTTMITGRITDRGTGLPVPEVKLRLSSFDGRTNPQKLVDEDREVTNTDGNYSLEVTGKHVDFVEVYLEQKNGYVIPEGAFFESGDCTSLDFELNPYDAYLKLTLQNESNPAGEIFYYPSGNQRN